ncbi:hypothetical protein [Arthrobacter sp. 131MFCol6.1]|uniref:hypothetical protein n=1 Tax=Arthrobacter sp. 131MFCol6.1 TaxID=1157944 RepID=UPI00036C58B0|nr:hypothetical protein [Arthrobacter sp. 131MFCol6.1]
MSPQRRRRASQRRASQRRAVDAGHSVGVLSRNPPAAGAAGNIRGAEYFRADVTTGEGIAAALAGADGN